MDIHSVYPEGGRDWVVAFDADRDGSFEVTIEPNKVGEFYRGRPAREGCRSGRQGWASAEPKAASR
jgi:hypothetical protein